MNNKGILAIIVVILCTAFYSPHDSEYELNGVWKFYMIYNRGTLSKETIRSIKEVYGTTTINLKQNDSFRLSIMGNSQTGIWCISEANAMTVQLEFSTGRVGEISTYHTSKDSWSIHLNDVSLVMHREKE